PSDRESYERRARELLPELERRVQESRERVVAAGGLFICGTERHESRRIDNQLRGRSGRQGDPGESRFFLSAEDDLVRLFAGDRIYRILRSEEHTSELQSPDHLVCRLLLRPPPGSPLCPYTTLFRSESGWSRPAGCSSAGPSATSRGGSTTSCVAARDVRATPASPASSSPPRTTSCACSPAIASTGS